MYTLKEYFSVLKPSNFTHQNSRSEHKMVISYLCSHLHSPLMVYWFLTDCSFLSLQTEWEEIWKKNPTKNLTDIFCLCRSTEYQKPNLHTWCLNSSKSHTQTWFNRGWDAIVYFPIKDLALILKDKQTLSHTSIIQLSARERTCHGKSAKRTSNSQLCENSYRKKTLMKKTAIYNLNTKLYCYPYISFS